MLTTDLKNKSSFFNSFDENLLRELTPDETSTFAGGFALTNDTDRTQTFSTFGATVPSQRYVLQPGASNNYPGDNVLFNSSRNTYIPVLQPVSPNDNYHFITQGDTTRLVGINEFRR